MISAVESEQILAQIKKILILKNAGQMSLKEAGTQIRKAAWRISEDLRINGIDLSTGSNQYLFEKLSHLIKA